MPGKGGRVKLMKIKEKKFVQDAFQRTNFLYQASMSILKNQPENIELVRHYMKSFRDIKEKKVIKISVEMKQSMCEHCNMLLMPGLTSTVRIRDNHRVVVKCLSCNSIRRSNTMKPSTKDQIKNADLNRKKRKKKRQKKKEKMQKKKKESGKNALVAT